MTETDCRSTKLRTRPLGPLLRNLGLLVLPLLLAACGGTGTGGDGGGTPPPGPNPLLKLNYTLPATAIGTDTAMVYSYFSNITETYGGFVESTERVPVPASREVEIRLDAEAIPHEINIERFFGYYLPWLDGNPPPMTISDQDLMLKVFSSVDITQGDSADADRYLRSHYVDLVREYTREGSDEVAYLWPVFASKAATVRASYTQGSIDNVVEVDLVPGWNLLYSHLVSEDNRRQRTFSSFDSSISITGETYSSDRYLGTVNLDYPVDGLSSFELDNLQSATPTGLLQFRSILPTPGSRNLSILGWLSPEMVTSLTRPLTDVLGPTTNGTITGAEDVGVTAVAIYTHGSESSDWGDPAESNGQIIFSTDLDHPVFLIYADRSATVHLSNVTLADGSILATGAAGLNLQFGWNTVAAEPITGTSVSMLRTVSSFSLPLVGREHH